MEGHKHIVSADVTLFELLAQLDSKIHVEVLKLYPNATLPTFSILNVGPGMIQMLYQSPRQLETLASGLIQGGAEYFNTKVDVDMVIVQTDPYKVKITVKQA